MFSLILKLKKIQNIREITLIAILLFTASFLRFYKINQLTVFNYDQARDALYTKRIVVDHKLRLLGPQSSPGFYTGPAYYYLMAPFLWAAELNPSGMDVGVAVVNTFTVLILYFLLKKLTENSIFSFTLSFLYSVQPEIVWQSRFSWNPNLTPFFSVLFILGLLLVLEKKTLGWLVSAISLGFLIQLHFTTISLLPMALLFIFLQRKNKVFDRWFLFSLFSFVAMMSPFLAVELRHNFPNTRYFYKFFTQGPAADLPPQPILLGIWEKLKFMFSQLPFGINNEIFSVLIVVVTLTLFFYSLKNEKQREKRLLVFYPIIFLILMSIIYRCSFFQYYLTFLYPLTFLILGVTLIDFFKKNIYYLFFLFLLPVIFSHIKSDFGIFKNNNLDGDLQKVASVIAEDAGTNKVFNIVGVRGKDRYDNNGVDYRYFLETFYKKRALDWDIVDYQNSEVVYVVSTVGELDPLASNIWEIGLFGPKEISQKWEIKDNTKIYKLLK